MGLTLAATISAATGSWRVGLAMLLGLVAFAVIGGLLVDPENARPLSVRRIAAAVLGAAVRQRPAGPQPVRGHHDRHSA